MAILKSEKIAFNTKIVRRDKEGHLIIIKGSMCLEDTIIINIDSYNNRAP